MRYKRAKQNGFSLIELMVVAVVFTIITGAVFTVLIVAEQRYKIESEVLDSFNGANVAMDQITRDIHQAGFPPANSYAASAAAAALVNAQPWLVALPFAWGAGAGYPGANCAMGGGGTCAPTPGNYDIIVEENPDPTAPGAAVQWIRYQLPAGSHTLLRASVLKGAGDPLAATTGGNLVPYLDGVMNNATPAEMARIQVYYPNMFPGNAQVPIFTYYCDTAAGPQLCTGANTALDIREVQITLIAEASAADPKTHQPRIVTLTGQALRINPNQ